MSLTVPNLLTLARMGLIPFFIIAVLDGQARRALAIFCVAGITDALDGFIARFFGQRSALGAYLDPIADKLLLTSAYVMLAIPGLHPGVQIPIWVTMLVIARDVLIVVVALILHLALQVSAFPPSPLSKVNTLAQIAAVLLVLMSGIWPRFETAAIVGAQVVGALTIGSGLDYIVRTNRLMSRGLAGSPRG
jgi:cardiolipin synthase